MKDLRTIILAAGKGTRMKSKTPKVLHAICGQPIVQFVLDIAKFVGSLKTYVVLGHQQSMVREYLNKDVQVIEQKKLLGTGDAVKTTQGYLRSYKGDVLILCGDTPLLSKKSIKELIRKHKKTKAACTFLTAVVHDPRGYGRIIRGAKAAVMAIREERDATEFEKNIAEINVGVYCFRSAILFKALKDISLNKRKREYYLTDIIELLVDQKERVESLETEDPNDGLGINTRVDLARAESIMRKRILNDYMLEGISVVDPDTTFIHKNVKIGQDTSIRPFTVIESNVRIGKSCAVGPFARLRSGTRIDDGTEVGNFVEVSRSQIGKKTLVKHFSYLGDAKVGSKVNIGAGVVTANFDGTNKNITRIDDQAFVGSDSILVAPVKIGKKAVTGAGSVLTKGFNVPDSGLAVGVPARINSRRKRR